MTKDLGWERDRAIRALVSISNMQNMSKSGHEISKHGEVGMMYYSVSDIGILG